MDTREIAIACHNVHRALDKTEGKPARWKGMDEAYKKNMEDLVTRRISCDREDLSERHELGHIFNEVIDFCNDGS